MKIEDLKKLENIFSDKIQEIEQLGVVDTDFHFVDFKREVDNFFKSGLELLEGQDVLRLGVVGQMNTGKSSFLNSLFFGGQEILPKAATPMTAGLTVLEYTDGQPHLDVEYFTHNEWNIFETYCAEYKEIEKEVRNNNPNTPETVIKRQVEKKATDMQKSAYEMVEKCDMEARGKIDRDTETVDFNNVSELQSCLERYVGTNGSLTSVVKSITIHLNDERLKGMQIVDTPGVNDPVSSREMRTREFLRTCHGVFFLSFAGKFFDNTDKYFLENRIGNDGIGTVLMLASKFDTLILNLRKFSNNLEGAIDQAESTITTAFNTHKADLTCRNLRIKCDFTSGIGYSLATKAPDKWDDVEAHVAKQMTMLFPDYFTADDEFKEHFLYLANFKKIKEDYLEKLFKARKDEIIGQKIVGYFNNNSKSIADAIDEIIGDLNRKVTVLNSVNQTDINACATATEEFNNLNEHTIKIFDDFAGNLQNTIRGSKVTPFNETDIAAGGLEGRLPNLFTYEIPRMAKVVPVTHKGMLYGTSKSNMDINGIDKLKLRSDLFGVLDNFAKIMCKFYAALFDKYKKEMRNAFLDAYTKAAGHAHFMNDAFFFMLDGALRDIDRYKVLHIVDDLPNGVNNTITGRQTSESRLSQWIDDCEKNIQTDYPSVRSQAKIELKRSVDSVVSSNRDWIEKFFNGITDAFYHIADYQVNQAINILNNFGGNISQRLNTEKEAYLDRLCREMANKEGTIQNYKRAIDILQKLKENLQIK